MTNEFVYLVQEDANVKKTQRINAYHVFFRDLRIQLLGQSAHGIVERHAEK